MLVINHKRSWAKMANHGSSTGLDESWQSVGSGLQGLLSGEAIYSDENGPSHHAEDHGVVDYNFEEELEAFLGLDSSARLIFGNYLPAQEFPGSCQSPAPAGNGSDYDVNGQQIQSQTIMDSEFVCYGMVSVGPSNFGLVM